MKINTNNDSNALALDIRNFGLLPPHLTKDWMIGLTTVEESRLPHPAKAIVEIFNSCNLDCPMCRVGQYGVDFNRILPLVDFKNILSQIVGLKEVRLNGLGESTLIPNFGEYLNFLFENNLKVELITNGSGKTEVYKEILRNNGSVIISWDAAEAEIFEKLRRPAKWDEYVNNILSITKGISYIELKNISLIFTLQKQNINQLSKLVQKCFDWKIMNIIVNVVKDNHTDWSKQRISEIENEFSHASFVAKQNNINLFLPSQIFGIKILIENAYQTHHEGCKMPWKEVVVRWNGDIQVCNMFNPFVYGNIHLNTFHDIWNNLFANLFRKMINTDKRHPYCTNCVYFEEAYNR